MSEKTLIEAIREALDQEMDADERVWVLGEDVGKKGGVFKATQGLFEKYGQQRVLDSPLAESSIVATAIGSALVGLRPVAEIQFADFIHPAFNQIVSQAARLRYRSNGSWTCPIVIRTPYGGGIHGGLYHSQSIEATFAHIPGLKVVAPSTPYDAKGLLIQSIRDPDPVLFLEHKKTYRMHRQEVPDEPYSLPIGQARVAREGTDITVIAYGMMYYLVMEVAQELAEQQSIQAEVVDPLTLRPLDTETVLNSCKKTGKVLLVYEDNKFLGYGAELSAILAEEAFEWLDAPVMRLAGPEVPAVPYASVFEKEFLPNTATIKAAMQSLAQY
jgi:2-oxoisovalerate dehydrogenase E1 component beta subunit